MNSSICPNLPFPLRYRWKISIDSMMIFCFVLFCFGFLFFCLTFVIKGFPGGSARRGGGCSGVFRGVLRVFREWSAPAPAFRHRHPTFHAITSSICCLEQLAVFGLSTLNSNRTNHKLRKKLANKKRQHVSLGLCGIRTWYCAQIRKRSTQKV